MELDQSILLALFAMIGSVLGSMLGLGGGVFIIPLFTLLLGVEPHIAIGASAVCVVTNSVVGSRRHLENRYVNLKLAMLLQSTTAAGAILGAFIALAIDASYLKGALGLLLIYAAYSMVKGSKLVVPTMPQDTPDPKGLMYDFQEGTDTIRYVPQRVGFGISTSGFAGVLSGMLGIGGGLIQVPVMNLIMKMPLRAAAGTSSFMVGMTSVATATVFYANGKIDPQVTAPAMVGVLLGSSAGSALTKRVKLQHLVGVFVVIMVSLSISMILSAFDVSLW